MSDDIRCKGECTDEGLQLSQRTGLTSLAVAEERLDSVVSGLVQADAHGVGVNENAQEE